MEIDKQFFKDTFGWGLLLWLLGYILGIVLFMIVTPLMIGWIITPIATAITIWVLFKKIKSSSLKYYFFVSIIWTILAVVLDYFFIVKVFKPEDGYYKPDVFFYYALTFILPIVAGFRKQNANGKMA